MNKIEYIKIPKDIEMIFFPMPSKNTGKYLTSFFSRQVSLITSSHPETKHTANANKQKAKVIAIK